MNDTASSKIPAPYAWVDNALTKNGLVENALTENGLAENALTENGPGRAGRR